MRVGVFGKLPARRDYVQHGVEPRLMEQIDPWLQRSLAESRRALGDGWLDAWLQAPIWRFWLGSRIAGITVLGALMPSVDGVGRYFPLCLLAVQDGLPPPEEDDQAAWFEAAETLLLATLSEGGTYEALLSGIAALPAPARGRPRAEAARDGHHDVAGAFAALRSGMMAEFYDRFSCWWVPPDEPGTPSRALIRRGLPAPEDYATMVAPDHQARLSPAMGGG